jgi:nuclear polyadenylated RNA-binding protein 3
MTDATPDPDDNLGPSHPVDDSGDYNPESIHYEAQEDDSAEEEEEEGTHYPNNEPPNEQLYEEEEYVENTYQPEHQPRPYPDYQQEFPSHHSPVASRSPELARSPTASRQYDPTLPVQDHTANNHDSNEMYKSPPAEDGNDTHPMPQQPPTDVPQDQSALPKSVDLQALLAGLVPARSKVSSPPQPRDIPVPQPPSQSYPPPGGLPPPAMNLPPDIMYQLQNFTSPPPQSAPQFHQSPPQHQAPPPQSGPVDIQPEDLALTQQEERLYENFLQNEREVVQSAQWDQFPSGTRMFIGNLPSDRIGKKEVFRLFYPYGRLAQISIKQAYGFVQFYEKADCDTAIQTQQGMVITGRRVRMFPRLDVNADF